MAIKPGIMKQFNCDVRKDGQSVFQEQNLTGATISKAVDTSELRNGQENSIFMSMSTNEKLTVSLESNVVMLQRLQALSGVTPEEDPTEIVIKPGQYPEAFELVLTSPFINADGKVEKIVEITIPSARPEASWELSTSSDWASGNTSTITFTAQVVDGVLATMRFLPPDSQGGGQSGSASNKSVYYGLLKAADTTSVKKFSDITEAMINKAVSAKTVTKTSYKNLNKVSLGTAGEADIHIIVVPAGKTAKKFNGISSQVEFDEELLGSARGQAITIGGESYLMFGEKSAAADTELFGYTS